MWAVSGARGGRPGRISNEPTPPKAERRVSNSRTAVSVTLFWSNVQTPNWAIFSTGRE